MHSYITKRMPLTIAVASSPYPHHAETCERALTDGLVNADKEEEIQK